MVNISKVQADGSLEGKKMPNLGVGTYDWTVYAYAADGVQFAHSQTYRFYIE